MEIKFGFLSAILITLLLSACSTSSHQSSDPSQIGTWRIDSQTHATWEGNQNLQSVRFASDSTGTDSTVVPDTTYFYDNGQIQAEIAPVSRDVYKGDFEFQITDYTTNKSIVDSLGYNHVTALNLGDAFSVQNERGSIFGPDHNEFKIQMNFNCNAVQNDTGNLQLAVISVPDLQTGIRDTLKIYELSTEGLYETARYVTCN